MNTDDRAYVGTRIVFAAIIIVVALIVLWATGVEARPDW